MAFAATMVVLGGHAHADPVIEVYETERPADATRVLVPVRDELEKLGHVAAPATLVKLATLPHRGLTDRGVTTNTLRAQIDVAIRDANHGHFDKALAALDGVFAAVHANVSVRWSTGADSRARDDLTQHLRRRSSNAEILT